MLFELIEQEIKFVADFKDTSWKFIIPLISGFILLTIISCGPNADEIAANDAKQKLREDSLVTVTEERVRRAVIDSFYKIQENQRATNGNGQFNPESAAEIIQRQNDIQKQGNQLQQGINQSGR